jgi:two-component system nitrogen regulation sensor histidine kinase GlnL
MHHIAFSVDNELKIRSWSKELETIRGKSFLEVQGVPYYEAFPGIYNGNSDAVLQVLQEGNPITFSCRSNCFYGGAEADISITPLSDETGTVIGANVAVKLCPNCFISRKLQESQALIDVGKIASTLAHGVRSPLNAIKGAAVYLGEKYANEKMLVEFTKIMEEEISRLDKFIKEFLSTSISYAEISSIDINSLLGKIEVFTSLQAHACNIEAIYEYGNIQPVMANSFQLEQAVLNIINNAMEAMHSGGKLIVKTRTESRHPGMDFVVIEISDTGSGMADSRIDDLSIPSKNGGRGYGLLITREVVQCHGGHLEIKSEKGAGTTVNLYLPVNRTGER